MATIKGVNICSDIIANDDLDTSSTNDLPGLFIESITLTLIDGSTSGYTISCKYSIYDNSTTGRTSFDPINFLFTGLTSELSFTYVITGDSDDIINDCYTIITNYLTTNDICYQPLIDTTLKVGLISCWEMDYGTGTIIYDKHGSYDITGKSGYSPGTSSVSWQTSPDSIRLDGTDDWGSFGNITDGLNPASAHSISIWVKRLGNSVDVTGGLLSRYYSSTGFQIYGFYISNDNHATYPNRIGAYYYDSSNIQTTLDYDPGSDIWLNNWMHCVYTRSGSSIKLYVNNVLVDSNSGGNGSGKQSTNSNVLNVLGAYWKSTTYPDLFFNGEIAQTAVWSKALSPTEVGDLYSNGNIYGYIDW